MTPEFDKYAKEYDQLLTESIKSSGYHSSYFDEQKIRELHRRIGGRSQTFNFLNFGCGTGKSEKFIRKYFPQSLIHCADVSAESLNIAAERNKDINNLQYHHFDNIESFDPGVKFEVIFVANVFHHIPEQLHVPTLSRLRQLLNDQGKLFIFEHNPINPLTRQAFRTCEFDQGCTMIPFNRLKRLTHQAGFVDVRINFTLFFPGQLQFLTPLEKYMTWLPIGAQYYAICN